ncbi:biotin/lipoyl-containing protein [Plantactinospora sp. BB1]|uniref:acetyl-CoA carboxylase biotin carboxyl carrier protein n=1 Tax=Plantactinospora sp. BB1 TaxID=2071627 RepID=UPI000D17D9CB|nr:biotin/lipoyl-containing protein [Plantactinospora sp. BB1]AVT36092.1 acetyl-CoA carboxylase biotin carboxyl carrier protein subunit [Plantactinospora sp. BB1]
MSEQVRESTAARAANGTGPVTANGTGPTAANGGGAHSAGAAVPAGAGPGDAALRGAVRAAAEVAELVRDPAIRRVRVRVADVQIEVEGAEPGREAVVTVTGDPAVTGAALSAVPGAAVAAVPGAAVAAVATAVAPAAGTVPVTAPLMGVFYRSPGPDQPPFAEIGQRVEAGDQVAIVEAMKMMNPVLTDRAGIVRAVHVTDGEVVEYEQPLLSIEPG